MKFHKILVDHLGELLNHASQSISYRLFYLLSYRPRDCPLRMERQHRPLLFELLKEPETSAGRASSAWAACRAIGLQLEQLHLQLQPRLQTEPSTERGVTYLADLLECTPV